MPRGKNRVVQGKPVTTPEVGGDWNGSERPLELKDCARAIALDDCALAPRRLQFEHDCCVRARTNIGE